MSNEVEVMDAVSVQNYQVAHSVMVMEQWGNGEVFTTKPLGSNAAAWRYGRRWKACLNWGAHLLY